MNGIKGTGIGCYFDDEFHDFMRLKPSSGYVSMYHFAAGGAVPDSRLKLVDPYSL